MNCVDSKNMKDAGNSQKNNTRAECIQKLLQPSSIVLRQRIFIEELDAIRG